MARRRSGARRAGSHFTIGAIVAVALVLAGVGLLMLGPDNAAVEGDDAVVGGVRAGSGPVAFLGGVIKRLGDNWNASARIQELEAENQQLRGWRDTALALAERMERYEDLLRMPREETWLGGQSEDAVSARVTLDSASPFKRTLLVNAGTDHGVKKGDIVVNENGLIGRVVTVGGRSARVLMLDDYNSRVPVMGLQSRARAVLVGDATQTPTLQYGALEIEAPRLDFQVPQGGLRDGERIVTSGDGGVFPRGLFVGVARPGEEGKWRVALGASSQPIDFVRVLPFASPELPEPGELSGEVLSSAPPERQGRTRPSGEAGQAVAAAPRSTPVADRPAPPRPTPAVSTAAQPAPKRRAPEPSAEEDADTAPPAAEPAARP